MKTYKLDGKLFVAKGNTLVELKETKVSKSNIGLAYWTNQGFKVTESNLSYKAKNGKSYKAVKGTTKDGKVLTLKSVRGGSVFTSKDF